MCIPKKQAKAWVFNGPGKALQFQSIDLPELEEGELLVKNDACTICKSDLHTFSGTRPGPFPSILGHEIIGEVLELQGEVKDFWGEPVEKGDFVTWSLMAFCGKCRNCKNGYPQKCIHLKKYGHEKMEGHYQLTGGFASHTHIYQGTSVYKLPKQLAPHLLTGLNCSWATVAAAIRLAGDVKGKNVLITGAGMLGILATMMCKEAGAENILVLEQNETRLALAKKFGADYLIPATADNKLAKELTKQHLEDTGVDSVLEMTGINSVVQFGLDVAGMGATIVLAGSVTPTQDVKINPERVVRNLLQIKGTHNYTPEDLAKAIDFIKLAQNKYPVNLLFDEKVFGLNTIDEAVERAMQSNKHRVVVNLNS